MSAYGPGDLDIFARAWDKALDAIPSNEKDAEQMKAVVLTGILDLAKTGVRDEYELAESGLDALERYEHGLLDAVMRESQR